MQSIKWILAVLTVFFLTSSMPAMADQLQQSSQRSVMAEQRVNVNQADAQTLADRLVGVGLKRAEAIVAYREQHGPFAGADDLMQVKGVGTATIKKNKERIEY